LEKPCIPSRGTKVPDRPEWIHEIKHDGYRLIVQRDGKRVPLWPATATTGAIAFR
jgi:ATP-dependent DNA ligase